MYARADDIRVWETVEVELTAETDYPNPYTDVELWAVLKGPEGFERRVWAFWDGGRSFKLRFAPVASGTWEWRTEGNVSDSGLVGLTGSFEAKGWTEEERAENPNRRGFIQPTPSNRSWQYADGTSFYMLADTWWGAGTWRYPFRGGNLQGRIGTSADKDDFTFEAGVAHLKASGFNSIGLITALPNWNDNGPVQITDDDGVVLRHGKSIHHKLCMTMHSDNGHRAFSLPGRAKGQPNAIPNYDRLNPAYFRDLDCKMFHLSEQGMTPYVETLRRDISEGWQAYHDWPGSMSRYLNYIAARYGSLNFIYSLVHYDVAGRSVSADAWTAVFDDWYERYMDGKGMPFGQPTVLMGSYSTYRCFGHVTEHPWLQAHSTGNRPKDHSMVEWLEEAMRLDPPIPGYCNEPYYVGWLEEIYDDGRPADSRNNEVAGEIVEKNSYRDNYFARTHAYGHMMSGALAGHVVGTGSRWCTGPGEPYSKHYPPPTETLNYTFVADQARLLREFLWSEGDLYRTLAPASEHLSARKHPEFDSKSLEGWAHLIMTPERDLALVYLEEKALPQTISNLTPNARYRAQWFDVRTGTWSDMGEGHLVADASGSIALPALPDSDLPSGGDWAGKLRRV